MEVALADLLEKPIGLDFEAFHAWLQQEAKTRNIQAYFAIRSAKMLEDGYLKLPTYIGNPGTAYEQVVLMGDLEDAWNDQEPKPEFKLHLYPMGKPHEWSGE